MVSRALSWEQKQAICDAKAAGESTTSISWRFGVHERTVQRLIARQSKGGAVASDARVMPKPPKARKRKHVPLQVALGKAKPGHTRSPHQIRQKIAARPSLRRDAPPPTDLTPRMKRGLFREVLPNGAVMRFSPKGALKCVERCPLYDGRYVSWKSGDVTVTGIEAGCILAVVDWNGEQVPGHLVFDGHEGTNTVTGCAFHASMVPAVVLQEEAQIRASMMAGSVAEVEVSPKRRGRGCRKRD